MPRLARGLGWVVVLQSLLFAAALFQGYRVCTRGASPSGLYVGAAFVDAVIWLVALIWAVMRAGRMSPDAVVPPAMPEKRSKAAAAAPTSFGQAAFGGLIAILAAYYWVTSFGVLLGIGLLFVLFASWAWEPLQGSALFLAIATLAIIFMHGVNVRIRWPSGGSALLAALAVLLTAWTLDWAATMVLVHPRCAMMDAAYIEQTKRIERERNALLHMH